MAETFKAFLVDRIDAGLSHGIREIGADSLPEREVLIKVDYSSVNYKDGLAITGKGAIFKTFPIVPGVDYAGTVVSSASPDLGPGQTVVVSGFEVGERHWGGFAQYAGAKAAWVVPLPERFSSWQAMAIGTAGYTAMLCVMTLEEQKVRPGDGEVLVTGASGGVGGVAVALLAKLGYSVIASSGRPETQDYLKGLGAAGFIARDELTGPVKPLSKARWAGAVDVVGGVTLANILSMMRYGGAVAATGLTGGGDLPATVYPFILRNVVLAGVESVMCPKPRRIEAWRRLAQDLPDAAIEAVASTIKLEDVPKAAEDIMANRVKGRLVVDVNA
jgi:acrylyl-CoA reductase (NADPH)